MKITDIILAAKQILIIGHSRPDGDAFGAGLSLLHTADKLNRPADFVCDSPYSPLYSFMQGFERAGVLRFSEYDAVICVDCGDILRLGKYYMSYFCRAKKTYNIDHHVTNTRFAAENLVLTEASGTC
ncbi:MAG: DHH family phosphoesterase, partial [Firmicutes bacterium]|nr:DHH family phosphoesterase [Bacillota bacterium]